MFSIIIPSYNNLNYLKLCIKSIINNSKFNHQIIVHVNEGTDGTLEFVKKNNINYTHSQKNIGLCSAVNLASKKSNTNFILYSHDDMYFCPGWDVILKNNVDKLNTNLFYLYSLLLPTSSFFHLQKILLHLILILFDLLVFYNIYTYA